MDRESNPVRSIGLLVVLCVMGSTAACRLSRDKPEPARPAYTTEELGIRLTMVDRPRMSITRTRKNDLEFRKLSCAVPPEEFVGVAESVQAVAKRKPFLDLCSPSGTVAVLTWIGSEDGPTDLRAFSTLGPEVDECIESALAEAVTPVTGRCATAVLLGHPDGAETATRALYAAMPNEA